MLKRTTETRIHDIAPRGMAMWLLSVAALVILLLTVGGITRLTESGLSMTQWQPLLGVVPPLNEGDWQRAFHAYQQIPQYREVAGPAGMTLAGFKFIYFWEWTHRLLARLVGVAFAVPLAVFAIRRAIPAGYGWRLVALFALGGLQGTFGWLMVRSGLTVRTEVSPYWLSIHLLTALTIVGGLVWTALDLLALHRNPGARPARLTWLGAGTLAVLAVQLLYGAWMAGLRAGYLASDWPTMQGRLFPAGVDWAKGAAAATSDPYLVHFIHRWWAWVVLVAIVALARGVKRAGARGPSIAMHSLVGTQIILGIATVMSGVALWLAVLHQLTGALLLGATVWGAHGYGQRRR